MTTIKANADMLEQQSGVESSLTDAEIKNHLEVVTNELRKQKFQWWVLTLIISLFEVVKLQC